ncbi:MAG: glycosyltransferase [Chloroflexi bacterium]|nr:glycosyltransferase [Chloroflexota bacterium]
MSADRPLLLFPFHDWQKGQKEGFRTRDGHLMQEIAGRTGIGPVVVVDRPVSMVEHLLRSKPFRTAGRVVWQGRDGAHRAWLTAATPNVLVVDTAVPDLIAPALQPRAWWFRIFSRPTFLGLLRMAVEAAGATGAPAIAWTPTIGGAIETLDPRPFVYDSLDNWLIHPTLRRQSVLASAAYTRLLPRADRVFVSGPRSAAVLRPFRSDIDVLPNGVDPGQFLAPRARPTDLPSGPIVGYAGKLAERIDATLIEAVGRRMPGVSFVFVGQVLHEPSVSRLRRLPNVHMLGDRHYNDLPAYLQHFDVAWIPHRVGEGETGGDPIKLYEYWAAGRPVVSTAIDGLGRYASRLAIVEGSDEAVTALADALRHPHPQTVPPDRTWKAITDRLLAAVFPPEERSAPDDASAPGSLDVNRG